MALELINAHITYYHMDAIWAVGLAMIYFIHPDYMLMQSWIYTTCLYPDTISQTEPHVYHYVQFFLANWLYASGHPM